MMLTKVENTFWLILLPLKTERRGIIAKFQILLLPTVRTGHIKTHEVCRLVSGFFDLAGAFDFRRRAANGFWPYRALNTFIPQQGWRTLFFNIRFERGKLVITDHIHGFFTVVFAAAPPRHQNPTPEEKRFRVSVLSRCFLPNHGASSSNAGTSLIVGST